MAQMNVNLAFSADTGKAKAQIAELQSLLSKIAYTGSTANTTNILQKDLQEASTAAKELQFHLNNAFNVSTGKFDLSMLDKSLKTSGSNITDLSTKLLGAGATGQQAFATLAQSISLADQPMLRVSKRMQDFAVTMKNTVKWQLSSSMLHGFMGAIQSAYGYAQDLNKSLTDIRIVTGYSTDQMAQFAEQANKAAKALSTTTTDYTNASLIYFQQGLSDAEVAARTDITVKMANAAGQSAEVVSEQLTAVWNNFVDGSKSLEYYADVMTALGAATASSSDEISEGLNKFSAVAESVGLSYEYATAALTTITSNTRESADIVGNALKTLFARLQGLKLGETLEDGVDLNKYSEALDKAGISIFEQNGELKAMDNILNDMAAKWGTMSNTQQVALAQTVAGVRQYNQLIALMENWDNGDEDSMMANLKTIENADGALQKQADIYADSWEAAQKRVQAAAEGIYQSLLDDDFFISINNGFANLLGGLDAFIDGAGGVKTVLTGIASVIITSFANKIPEALDNIRYNLKFLTKGTKEAYSDIQKQMDEATEKAFTGFTTKEGRQVEPIAKDSSLGYQITAANELTAARSKLALVSDKMSASEQQMANTQLGIIEAAQQEVIALKQKNEALQESINLQQKAIKESEINGITKSSNEQNETEINKLNQEVRKKLIEAQDTFNETSVEDDNIGALSDQVQQLDFLSTEMADFADLYQEAVTEINSAYNELGQDIFNKFISGDLQEQVVQLPEWFNAAFTEIKSTVDFEGFLDDEFNFTTVKIQMEALSNIIPKTIQEATGLDKIFKNLSKSLTGKEFSQQFKLLEDKLKDCKIEGKDFKKVLEDLYGKGKIDKLSSDMHSLETNTAKAAEKAGILKSLLNEFNPSHVVRTSEALGALAGLMGNVVTVANSTISIFKAWANPDLSGWEKFSATLSGVATIIPTVISSLQGYGTVLSFVGGQIGKNIVMTQAQVTAHNKEFISTNLLASTKKTLIKYLGEEQLATLLNIVATEKQNGATQEAVAAKILEALASNTTISAKGKEIIARTLSKVAIDAETVSVWNLVKALMASAAAWIAANPLLAIGIGAIIGVITAITVGIINMTQAQEKANVKIAEATDKYEKEKSKLEELKNELQSVQDQIDELNSKDSLSIVEQAELDKLEARKKLLEAQVALQEKLTQAAQKEQADTITENWDKSSQLSNKPEITKATGEYGLGLIETTNEYGISTTTAGYTRQQETIDEYIARMKQTEHYDTATGQFDDVTAAFIASWREEIEAATAEYASQNQEQYEQNEQNYQAVAEYAADHKDYQWTNKKQMQDDIAQDRRNMYGEDYDDLFIKPLLNAAEQLSITQDQQGNYEITGIDVQDLDLSGVSQSELNKWINEEITKNAEAFTELQQLEDFDLSKLSSDQLFLLLDNLDQLEHFDGSNMQDLINYLTELTSIEAPKFNLEQWKQNYSAQKDIVGDLETGDTIDATQYNQLSEAAKQYFTDMGDGTYTLTQDAAALRDVVNDIAAEELRDEITDVNTIGGMSVDEAQRKQASIEAGGVEGFNFINSGQDQTYIEDVNAKYGTSFTEFGQAVDYVTQQLGNLQSSLATTADELGELDTMFQTGEISGQDYINQLQTLGAQYENARDELTRYQQALADGNDEEAAAADDALHQAIRAGELAEEWDLSAEAIERYAEELKDSGKYSKANGKALAEMAKDQLRFDRAVENATEHMEDWKKELKTAQKTGHLSAETTEQLAEAYGDLLDIDGDLLPSSFLKDIDNLELMEKALKGDEEAYDALLAKTRQEIAAKVGLDDAEFQSGFNDLLNKYYQASSLDDIEVGASLDNAGFLQGLTDMVNAAGMTADQATSYLASMGVDADVVTEPVTETDPVTYVNAVPTVSWSGGIGTHPATGFPTLYRFPSVGYSLQPTTLETTKQTTGMALRVTSASKSSGGGIKHSGSNAAQSAPSSGGGGGSSAPKYAEKKNDSDKTRYHTIQNQLEDLSASYDSISDAADRAFGRDKIKKIDEEIAATDKLIDKQEEYVAALQADLPKDKAIMEAYYNKVIGGPAMEFDEDGNIANFDAIQDAMYAKYNQMASTYTEDSEEWQVFEKQYEQMEKYLEQYEETYDMLRDEEAKLQEMINQRIDLELEKVSYNIELQLDVSDDSLALIDFQLEQIEDDAYKAAESIALATDKANEIYKQMLINRQALDDTLGLSLSDAELKLLMAGDMSVLEGKNFTEDQIDAVKDYRDNLLELNQELIDVQEQIEDQVMQAFEEYHDELDRGMEKFDHYNNMLESYQNIVDIVGKDVLGLDNEALADISEAQVENSINQLKASKDAYDSLQKQADDALQKQQEAEMKAALVRAKGDEETAKSYEEDAEFWKETYTEMNEAAIEAQEEMMDNWGNTLEAIATQFELAVERAVQAFNDAIYEFGGLEGMSDDFSRQKEMDDMYLEDYQQIYELSKLTRDINNTIDDTENIAGKQKLKKLLEEINKLQEDGVEMSEYDLEYLQAEYNLRLAELELEEAQKAKDTVRLSRDNEGNWSYVYTQNTDAVDAAQQKYEDALYAMQDLSSNYIDEMSEQLIATSQEMQEALANVRVEDFASQEEYYAELARIEAQYQEQMAAQEAELNKAIANNKELYDTDWKNYSEATGYKISKAEEFATKFSDTLLGSLIGSEEATSNFTAIVGEATDSLVQGLANAAATYYTNLNTAMEAAGTSTSEFADLLAEDVEAIKIDSAEAADAVAQMAEKMDEEMTKITERVQKFQEDYGREIDKIIAKNLEMVETFNDMLEHLSIDPDQINVTYDISRSQDGEGGETVEVPEGTASGYTGMYTGDWGSKEGRVAVLHEKELLLNQDDTVNMLEALKVSKYMLEILNANTQMMSQGMGSLFPASVDNSVSEILEQQVSIVAEFPNAVNHSEIEEAFDTLINRAAQYANRK